MSTRLRTITRRFFIYANIFLALLFVLASLAPYLNPVNWWMISFLGLGFPVLLFILLAFLVGWLFVRRKFALISLIALIPGIKSIMVFFAFHPFSGSFDYKKEPGSIRIVTWNVARFVELKKNNNKGSQTRLKMMELLKKQDADILCLQEFQTSPLPEYYNNIAYIQSELNYPYFAFCFDEDGDNLFYSSIIFSRYPIIDSGFIRYPRPSLPEVLVHADIKVNDDTVRVYTTHLQSLQFKKSDYDKISKIETGKDSLVSNSRTVLSKIKRGFVNRSLQADIIHQVIGDSPHPVIYCSDMNDVPNSYTYFKVKGDMQDVFLKKGFGIGRTFNALSPTLRIDYIFTDKKFSVKQFHRVINNYSDHYMLVSDLELKK